MVKDSLIWKLTANVANTCAQSCLYTVLLPQAYNVPICSSLFYCLFALNLFSIHSPSTLSSHSCLCTSAWLFPILSIYFPLGLALSILFTLNFYLCFLRNFSVYLFSVVSYTCSHSICFSHFILTSVSQHYSTFVSLCDFILQVLPSHHLQNSPLGLWLQYQGPPTGQFSRVNLICHDVSKFLLVVLWN